MSPTLYEQSHGIYYECKGCETGPTVYLPYPSRLRSLTVCRCLEKGSTFSSVILIPWVLVQQATRSADQRLSNWANWVADTRERGRAAGQFSITLTKQPLTKTTQQIKTMSGISQLPWTCCQHWWSQVSCCLLGWCFHQTTLNQYLSSLVQHLGKGFWEKHPCYPESAPQDLCAAHHYPSL